VGAWLVAGFPRTGVGSVAGSPLEQRECPVGVRDGLGIHIVGGLPGHEFLPGGPGEHALDRDHLCRLEPRRDITAESDGQGLLVVQRVLDEASGQAGRAEHQPVERQNLRMVIKARDGVTAVEAGPEMLMQRGQRGDARPPALHDPGGLTIVIGDPVQDQILLGGEVPEEGRLGNLGGRSDVGHRDLVEAVGEKQRDGRVGDGVPRARLLAGPQPGRLNHANRITFVTRLPF
jgi:hypothetical protein